MMPVCRISVFLYLYKKHFPIMKRSILLFSFLLLFYGMANAQTFTIKSPDQRLELIVVVGDEQISWSANYDHKTAIKNTVIGIQKKDGDAFGIKPRLTRHSEKRIDQTIRPVVPHKDAEILDVCNELTLEFRPKHQLVFRVYNEGLAYRFKDQGKKGSKITNEILDIQFPEGTYTYFPEEESMYSHNERLYNYTSVSGLTRGAFCSLPVMFETPVDIKVLFTETALHRYPGMFWQKSEKSGFTAIFPKYVLETKPDQATAPDRNEIITLEGDYIADLPGNFDFPWRVFMISDTEETFVASNLTFQLAEPVAIDGTDWIKPGKVAWDWYNANNIFGVDFKSGINDDTYRYYIDFASKNGIEYVILDEGWIKSTTEILEDNDEIDVKGLVEYAESKNVGIILWVLWKPLQENMSEILETYAGWGAKGIKVDFMQRNDQGMVESYEEIAKEAARLQLLVDYHGAFKPSGLRRKYPNVLNYEGVKGNENNKWSADITPEHNVTIPFIRMAAGPMDYTPGAMRNAQPDNYLISFDRPMSLGTRCHEVAMYVVYEAPIQMMCESPSIYYREQESVDFISKAPVTWDETIVLEGKVADYIIVARRKGDNWHIGAMTDWEARSFEIDLSFLPEGNYVMTVMQDGINADRNAEDYKKTTREVKPGDKINIKMASGGGWAARIELK
jgi:alpha-glucosidase